MKKHLGRWLLWSGLVLVLVLGVTFVVPSSRNAIFGMFQKQQQAPQVKPRDGEHLYQGKTLDEWVEKLKGGNSEERHVACLALQYFRPEDAAVAIPVLLPMLKDKDQHLRMGATYALGRIGPPAREAVLPLTELLSDEQPAIRAHAAESLDYMIGPQDKAAVPAMSKALQDSLKQEAIDDTGRTIRVHVAIALGKVGPDAKEAVPQLSKLVGDKEIYIRSAATEALGKIGSGAKPAVPVLAAALEDKDPTVRVDASLALWRVEQSPKSIPYLIDVFKSDKNAHVRQKAAGALGMIGVAAKDAVPILLDAAQNDTTRGVNGRFEIRTAAAMALKQIDPEAAAKVGRK